MLQISGKDLGALAMRDFCPRCFWIQRRTKLPWQIFPGVFSSIDSYSKKVVHGQFDTSGMPAWLAPLGELKGYKDPPSAHRFRVAVEEHGLLLTGGGGLETGCSSMPARTSRAGSAGTRCRRRR